MGDKDEQAEDNKKGNVFGLGNSNNENALEWAFGEKYGGCIVGTTLHYLDDKDIFVAGNYDELGAFYCKHEFVEKTLEINSKNFGAFGDVN